MSGLKLRGLTFPEKLEPKTSEKAQLEWENKAAPLGTGYWRLYLRGAQWI